MHPDWSALTGNMAGAWRLDSFIAAREGRADYIASNGTYEARLQMVPSGTPEATSARTSWKLARDLSHDNLAPLVDTGDAEIDGRFYAYGVSEMPDDDIGQIIRERRLDAEESQALTTAAASALSFLHQRSLRHGAVTSRNIYIIGQSLKLGLDNIAPAASAAEQASDLKSLAMTLAQAIAGASDRRATESLPAPYRSIAIGCANPERSGWTAETVLDVLNGGDEPAPPPPVPSSELPSLRRSWAIAAGVIALVLAIFAYRAMQGSPAAATTAAPGGAPIPAASVPATDSTSASRAGRPTARSGSSPENERSIIPGWAVIAARYRDYDAASKRASTIMEKTPGLFPTVIPAKGNAKTYFVVFGSGLSRDEAERIKREVRDQGAPKDTYVSKLRE